MQSTTTTQESTMITTRLRTDLDRLLGERDLRFYDSANLHRVLANRTAGDVIRDFNREPLLDEAGAAVLGAAIRDYVLPLDDAQALSHNVHILRFCPRVAS